MSKFSVTDKLFFQYLISKRGHICEIHQRECPGIGTMHILSKAYAPRLRYDEFNAVLACWFGAHYPTHHDPDGAKATYARHRICQIRGYATWEALRQDLKLRVRMKAKIDLKALEMYFKLELKKLTPEINR